LTASLQRHTWINFRTYDPRRSFAGHLIAAQELRQAQNEFKIAAHDTFPNPGFDFSDWPMDEAHKMRNLFCPSISVSLHPFFRLAACQKFTTLNRFHPKGRQEV
jgi:hypothetical protein